MIFDKTSEGQQMILQVLAEYLVDYDSIGNHEAVEAIHTAIDFIEAEEPQAPITVH